jgi:hypothetical protein
MRTIQGQMISPPLPARTFYPATAEFLYPYRKSRR